MTNWFNDQELESQLKKVNDKMRTELKSGNDHLNGSLDYLFSNGGKMLRPAFLLIGSRFGKNYNKKIDEIIDLATAIETLHVATLLHDDVIDEAKFRRGQPSIQSKYSKEYAIYMGDYLLSKCFLLLTELQIPKELAVRLAKVVTLICLGEMKQHKNRFNKSISISEYIKIISGKTASLIAIGLSAGSYITKTDENVIKLLAHAGYKLGIAFQIIDDLLDFIGNENDVGKDLKSDLIQGYYSLPVILALSDESVVKDELNKLFDNGLNDENIDSAINLIKKSGAIEKTKSIAIRYHDKSLDIVNRLPNNEGKTLLLNIIPKLVIRIK